MSRGFWDRGDLPTGPNAALVAPPRSALSVVRGKPQEIGLSLQYDF